MKALVGTFNKEKPQVGAFSGIVKLCGVSLTIDSYSRDISRSTQIQDTHLAVCLALVPHAVPHCAHDGGAPTLDPVARAVPALEVVLLGRVLDGNLRRVRPQVSSGGKENSSVNVK